MTSNADKLIKNLSPEIEQKCKELQASRKEKMQSKIFALLCLAVTIIPALLIYAGFSLTLLIAPLIFMSLSVILLLPILISGKAENQGGKIYEQA